MPCMRWLCKIKVLRRLLCSGKQKNIYVDISQLCRYFTYPECLELFAYLLFPLLEKAFLVLHLQRHARCCLKFSTNYCKSTWSFSSSQLSHSAEKKAKIHIYEIYEDSFFQRNFPCLMPNYYLIANMSIFLYFFTRLGDKLQEWIF